MERRRGDDVGIKNGNINLGSGNEIEVEDDNLTCPQAEDSDDAELDDDCFHQFLDVDVKNVGQGSRGSNHLAEFESVHSEAVTASELPNENTLAMLSDLEDDELYEEYACDDKDNKAITRYEKYNCAQMCKEFEFKLGMEFNSVQQFREALKEYCLLHGYDVKFLKNDKERCRVRCKKKCGWLILVSKVGGSMTFRVKTLGPKHTCGVTFNSRLATSKWVSEKIVDHMRMNKNLKLGDVVSIVKQNYMVQPSINKAFWARKIAKKTIEGDHKEEYNKLVNFCNEVKKRNPQSTFAFVTDTTYYVDRPRVFKRLYVCLEPVKRGFMKACRPIIGLDGCFLKGTYGGILLVAVARDPNDQYFPLAVAVVETENKDSWTWFLKQLFDDIGSMAKKKWVFISDQQKGLVQAFGELLEGVEHRYCVRHLYANIKSRYGGGTVIRDLVIRAAKATYPQLGKN
ncbi:uncharacterized protein LOC114732240 [Neltuma alba]|uniref:uncharacterized protein LOC114732240 n=1 Tax=Neltuma alba TaxID=207710 RepID=UPI0010A38998|nr:uncharacterized protein LOC114732240 [Prosopis alba]